MQNFNTVQFFLVVPIPPWGNFCLYQKLLALLFQLEGLGRNNQVVKCFVEPNTKLKSAVQPLTSDHGKLISHYFHRINCRGLWNRFYTQNQDKLQFSIQVGRWGLVVQMAGNW
jgi:hypothetical protein